MMSSASFLQQASCVRDRLPHMKESYRMEQDEPESEDFSRYRRFSQLADETRARLPHYVPAYTLENDEALAEGYLVEAISDDWRRNFQLTNEAFAQVASEVRAQTPHFVPEYATEHDGQVPEFFHLAKSP